MRPPSPYASVHSPQVVLESMSCATTQVDAHADVHGNRQPRPRRSKVATFWARALRFERENIECALIVLKRVAHYGGETSGLVRWARLTVARHERRDAA
jgi:hypothetical protein